jgi:hypothetical protein
MMVDANTTAMNSHKAAGMYYYYSSGQDRELTVCLILDPAMQESLAGKSKTSKEPFRFLDLPAELRLDIYDLYFSTYHGGLGITKVSPLIATCGQIFSEALPRLEHAVKEHLTQWSCRRVLWEKRMEQAPEGGRLVVMAQRYLCDVSIRHAEKILHRIAALQIFRGR